VPPSAARSAGPHTGSPRNASAIVAVTASTSSGRAVRASIAELYPRRYCGCGVSPASSMPISFARRLPRLVALGAVMMRWMTE
jgi:hypothetical protein